MEERNINEIYPYKVSRWHTWTGTQGERTYHRGSWLEVARCKTEEQAKLVAECVHAKFRYVIVSTRIEGEVTNIHYYPDLETIRRELG